MRCLLDRTIFRQVIGVMTPGVQNPHSYTLAIRRKFSRPFLIYPDALRAAVNTNLSQI